MIRVCVCVVYDLDNSIYVIIIMININGSNRFWLIKIPNNDHCLPVCINGDFVL